MQQKDKNISLRQLLKPRDQWYKVIVSSIEKQLMRTYYVGNHGSVSGVSDTALRAFKSVFHGKFNTEERRQTVAFHASIATSVSSFMRQHARPDSF